MPKLKILILGYSSFVKRRLSKSLKKNRQIDYYICSKSNKLNKKEKILFNKYEKSLEKVKPDIVYISLINSLHYKYAKIVLKKGFNVIVDKPITVNINEAKELLKLARKKNLLLAESTLFNYHIVFKRMLELCGGKKNIKHIQTNFNVPDINKKTVKIKGDCESDMSPYAAASIRIFGNSNIKNLNVFKEYIYNSKLVENFYVMANLKNCLYFGNFGRNREYLNQITLFTKNKIIISPNRAFSLPSDENLYILLKEKNDIKKIKVKKDDCIKNFFTKIIYAVRNKQFKFFYKNILDDAIIRDKIKKI